MAAVAGLLATSAFAGGAFPTERPGAKSRADDPHVELGRRLFFDPAVSRSGRNSCASCHDPEHGFSDPSRRSEDDVGFTRRHSQTILDAELNPNAHWDGEFLTVEELATARLGPMTPGGDSYSGGRGRSPRPTTPIPVTPDDGPEGARPTVVKVLVPTLRDVSGTLQASGRYREAMAAAYGSPDVTLDRLATALGAYVKSVRSTLSPFDRFLRGQKTALDDSAQRGLKLFQGRAGCVQCHTMASTGRWPLFTDYKFHDTGIAWKAGQAAATARDTVLGPDAVAALVDSGRQAFSTVAEDARTFKTPTLRDVALRGPYMHDGSLRTLEEVVGYYARGCTKEPNLDSLIRPFEASAQDVADLVAFLHALTGEVRPGLAPSAWARRAPVTKLRFVNGRGEPMKQLGVTLVPDGETLPGDHALTSPTVRLTTDDRGRIEFKPPFRTHARIVLDGDVEPAGGAFVPDSCGEADVVVPVIGTCTVVVTMPAGVAAPDSIVAERGGPIPSFPFEAPPGVTLQVASGDRSSLRRVQALAVGDHAVAAYEAWVLSDRSNTVFLRVPGWPSDRVLPILNLQVGATLKTDAP
jgi:cytochrome c peroxidase